MYCHQHIRSASGQTGVVSSLDVKVGTDIFFRQRSRHPSFGIQSPPMLLNDVVVSRCIKTHVAMPSSSAEEDTATLDGARETGLSRGEAMRTFGTKERVRIIDILRGQGAGRKNTGDDGWASGLDQGTRVGDSPVQMKTRGSACRILREARRCAKKPEIRVWYSEDKQRSSGEEETVLSSMKAVLDWLYVSPTDITPQQLADLASTYAYDKIHVIDVGSMNVSDDAIAEGVCWMGASRLPSGPVCVSAFLNRLKHRFTQRYNDGKSVVILTYSSSTSYLTLHALALFFFMHCWLDESDARSLAAEAVGKQIPPVSIIDSGIEELAACGKGWLQRVIIEWPYHARSSVDIAGEICGGWHITRRLRYDQSNRRWKIQIWGLPPGAYTFKFVVDNHWCVDLKKPLSVDDWGNDNNTATVIACGGLDSTERLKEKSIAENSDGMAASYTGKYETTKDSDKRMLVVVEPSSPAFANSTEDRLRLARFGASLLSYYKKISYRHEDFRSS